MTLLRNALNGSLPSNIILIEDSVECDGLALLLCFVKAASKRYDQVHVFCADCTTALLLKKVESTLPNRLTCHRIFEDPAGWMLGDSPPHSLTSNLSYKTDLFSYFKKFNAIQKIASNYAVIVDSLSLLLLYNSIGRVCRMLQNLQKYSLYSGGQASQVICLLHVDVHEEIVVKSIEHLATTILHIQPVKTGVFNSMTTSITHKSTRGKINREVVNCRLSYETLDITEEVIIGNSQPPEKIEYDDQIHQLASKLTFSVALKDDEKKSRAQLVLPYEAVRHESLQSSSGKIFYEPDAADDFDEEDPDDDLDV